VEQATPPLDECVTQPPDEAQATAEDEPFEQEDEAAPEPDDEADDHEQAERLWCGSGQPPGAEQAAGGGLGEQNEKASGPMGVGTKPEWHVVATGTTDDPATNSRAFASGETRAGAAPGTAVANANAIPAIKVPADSTARRLG
jgi:hypothetical protein